MVMCVCIDINLTPFEPGSQPYLQKCAHKGDRAHKGDPIPLSSHKEPNSPKYRHDLPNIPLYTKNKRS